MSSFFDPDSPSNLTEYTVSEISGAIKRTVEETFGQVRVRGEISGYRGPHSSGHAYFSLKDDKARIEAVIWRGSMSRLRFQPEEGMEVIATGKVTTYPRLVQIPDRHRADGAGRRRRADGTAGGAQAQAWCRGAVRSGAASGGCPTCRASSALSHRRPALSSATSSTASPTVSRCMFWSGRCGCRARLRR